MSLYIIEKQEILKLCNFSGWTPSLNPDCLPGSHAIFWYMYIYIIGIHALLSNDDICVIMNIEFHIINCVV